MNNLKNILFPLMIILMFSVGSSAFAADEYTIDPVHSSVLFKVGHLEISYVRGVFTCFSGTIVADKNNPENSLVDITVLSSSIDTNNIERDEHLRSEEFFHAIKYPEITFKSTGVKKTGNNTYDVTGDFTLHGVTKQITVKSEMINEGKDMWGGHRMGFSSEFEIKRSDYGMDQLIPAAGDKVHISLILEAVKN